ncbi:MFS transporter [Streptomyces sp. NPDC047108]|uniref:MFS transporter n=1 Tax=Streptomyces sp. NPDC047108 TaxID=3155025 RepID=UPI0034113B19
MVLLDETVVAVALDPMARDLDLNTAAMNRVVLVYVLALSSCVAVGGMAARRYGLLPVFRAGAVIFALASGCCGLTPPGPAAEPCLLAARAFQGAGAALMLPVATTAITHAYVADERGKALTAYAGVAQIFFVLGPLSGALLTQLFSWRAVFLINIPTVGVVLWALAKSRFRNHAPGEPFQVFQPAFMVLALAALLLSLYQIGSWGLEDARTVPVLSSSLVLVAVSVWVMIRAARPLLHLRILKNRTFAVSVAVTFLVQAAQFPVLVHGAVFLRQSLHLTPLGSGVSLLPFVSALAAGTFASGYLLESFRSIRMTVLCGLVTATLGTAAWSAALSRADYQWQIPWMVLAGFGMGMPIPALSATMMGSVSVDDRADASVLRQTLRQLGGAFGIAMAGALVLAANGQRSNAAGIIKAEASVRAFVFAGVVLGAACALAAIRLPRESGRARKSRSAPAGNHRR